MFSLRVKNYYYYYYYYLLTAIGFLPRGSCPYTGIDKTNKNQLCINETIQKHCKTTRNTVNTNTHNSKIATQMSKHPHITKHAHTHTHTFQNKLKQTQYKIHTKRNSQIHSRTLSMSP